MKSEATLAALLENFFIQRLMNQRQASPHTISSYRDTFRLLLQFAQKIWCNSRSGTESEPRRRVRQDASA
jgi:site-specific recombinase XerC